MARREALIIEARGERFRFYRDDEVTDELHITKAHGTTEMAVRTLLTVRPSLTRADYQAFSHISANTAQLDIAELLQAGLILRRGAGPCARYCLVDGFRQIPPQPPRYHNRVAQQSPSDPHEVAIESPTDPHHIATESPQSELEQALASILRSLSVSTRGGETMAETDAMKDKVEGKLHEVKGAVTGNKGEELKGKLQGAKGDVEHNMSKPHREDVRDEATQRTP